MANVNDLSWDDRTWLVVTKGGLLHQCPKCHWWTSNKDEHMNGPVACQFQNVPIKYIDLKEVN